MSRSSLHAVLGPRSAVVLSAETQQHTRDAVTDAVLTGAPLSALLTALTSGGLAATPDFGCVVQEQDSTRLVLRGNYSGTVLDGAAGAVVSGIDVTTWLEQLLPADVTIELRAGEHVLV